jgi:prolyl-tRNA synthetase
MRLSHLLAPTLRENPAEAEVVSHQLLMRAGYIRRLAAGIYNYYPLMQRVLQKVSKIVREEMDRAGAQELLMPIMQPADIWQESGRWDVYGKELIRLKDRHDRDCVLGPTHEEVITTIAKQSIQSYRQLPMNLYQIQNKYRDEIRPRFGLLRGREFIMKDAYSFHVTQECLEREYDVMAKAYQRIFDRCGLETRMVRSDSGAIGGSVSHEFMVLTQTHSGECDVYYCDSCEYAANSNRAESVLPAALTDGVDSFPGCTANQEIETPDCDSIEKLAAYCKIPASLIAKALLYIKDEAEPFIVMIRGDLDAEEIKVQNAIGANDVRLATAEEVAQYTGSSKGYIGIADLTSLTNVGIVYDHSVLTLKNFIIAANKPGYHTVLYNWPDGDKKAVDVRLARVGDGCPECSGGKLQMTRGIEVGNIFQLGTKYSQMMSATYTGEDGTEQLFIMGCYGIGVSRTAASAVERFHDEHGIIWPIPIAPYHVVVVPANVSDETQATLAETVYRDLQAAGVEVVLDDRDERAGVKFKDADLLGFPIRVTVGRKAAEGVLELKRRDAKDATDVAASDVVAEVVSMIEAAGVRLVPARLANSPLPVA